MLTKLGILTKAEIDSRYHVRLERYIKDMLIELHTLGQIVDTMILPACYSYHGLLADAAAKAKTAGHHIGTAGRGGERGRRADRAAA